MRIGIIGAMPQEIDRIRSGMQSEEQHRIAGRTYHVGTYAGIETVLVFSRWGKVAAAMTATAMIERLGVDAILFTGVAGGIAKEIHVGDIVVATDLLQHDFDVSKTGMAMRFEIPLLGISTFQVRPELIAPAQRACEDYLAQRGADADHPERSPLERSPRVHLGTIASGDQFIADPTTLHGLREAIPGLLCVEMEGAAVAQVCHEYRLPYLVIRTISDHADNDAPEDFTSFIEHTAKEYSAGILTELLPKVAEALRAAE